MTVSSTIAVATLNWTGVETTFTPGFQAQEAGDVSVVFTAPSGATTALTLNVGFSIALDGAGNVTVTPIALPAAPGTLTFTRNSSYLQPDHFQDGVPWSAEVIEQALDLGALRDQELRRDISGIFIGSFAAWFLTLPTDLPTEAGWWNNGGVPCYFTP